MCLYYKEWFRLNLNCLFLLVYNNTLLHLLPPHYTYVCLTLLHLMLSGMPAIQLNYNKVITGAKLLIKIIYIYIVCIHYMYTVWTISLFELLFILIWLFFFYTDLSPFSPFCFLEIFQYIVDLPEIKGTHRKFRSIVSSIIGMKIINK